MLGALPTSSTGRTGCTDIEAFRYGLDRFPSLERVTVTPAAHVWLYNPLYKTPMIRALPLGFVYPEPHGWPCKHHGRSPTIALPWDDDDLGTRWRGFRIVARELIRQKKHVAELVIDAHSLNTGLSCRLFDKPCQDYNNLVAIIQQPGFARLQLDLTIDGQEDEGWHSFHSGLLRRALSQAVDLEDFRFGTNYNHKERPFASEVENHVPLLGIFPIEKWPRLKHFGLTGHLVTQADVILFLASLPPTVRSVELSFLVFVENGGSYVTLLEEMRDTLGWRERPEDARPAVSIGIHFIGSTQHRHGHAIWVDKEVHEFLYNDGETPFEWHDRTARSRVPTGKGVIRDAFDPMFEKPHLSWEDNIRLGYYEGTTLDLLEYWR